MLIPSTEIGSSAPHSIKSWPGLVWHGTGFPVSHMPEKSGLPSRVRGVGAVRLTFPSRVRGTPAVGYFSHCATEDVDGQKTLMTINAARIEAITRGGMGSFS